MPPDAVLPCGSCFQPTLPQLYNYWYVCAVLLQDSAQEQLHRASERSEDASRDAKQQLKSQQQQGRARDDMDDVQGSIGARVQFAADERSGRADTGGSSSGSHEHGKGLGGKISVSACCDC